MAIITPLPRVRSRREKVQRIARGLGAIGEAWLARKEREEKRKQQQFENEQAVAAGERAERGVAVSEQNAVTSQMNAVTSRGQLNQRILEYQNEIEEVASGQNSDFGGISAVYEKVYGRAPTEKEAAMMRQIAEIKDAGLKRDLTRQIFPTSTGTEDVDPFSRDSDGRVFSALVAETRTENPQDSLLFESLVGPEVLKEVIGTGGVSPGNKAELRQRLTKALNDKLSPKDLPWTMADESKEGGPIEVPKKFKSLYIREAVDYLIANLNAFYGGPVVPNISGPAGKNTIQLDSPPDTTDGLIEGGQAYLEATQEFPDSTSVR